MDAYTQEKMAPNRPISVFEKPKSLIISGVAIDGFYLIELMTARSYIFFVT